MREAVAAWHSSGAAPTRREAAHGQRPLDTFFPFDPYLLRSSAAHLELGRTYIRWQPRDDEEDDDLLHGGDGTSHSTPSAFGDRTNSSVPEGSYPDDIYFKSRGRGNGFGAGGFATLSGMQYSGGAMSLGGGGMSLGAAAMSYEETPAAHMPVR